MKPDPRYEYHNPDEHDTGYKRGWVRYPDDGLDEEDEPTDGSWWYQQAYKDPAATSAHPQYFGVDPAREGGAYGALMAAPPFQEPETPQTQLLPLRDLIQDAIDELTPRERWVFDAKCSEQLSYAQVAKQLSIGKTTAYDIYARAVEKLRAALSQLAEFKEYT